MEFVQTNVKFVWSKVGHDCKSTETWLQCGESAVQHYKEFWLDLFERNPWHVLVETALILGILYVVFKKRTKREGRLSKREVDDLVEEWVPEPLVPTNTMAAVAGATSVHDLIVVERMESPHVFLRGYRHKMLNMSSCDFLGLGARPDLKEDAQKALDHYGCGSCGPRGFYGTMDAHLELEDRLAKFFGTAEAISYSDAESAVASAVSAFVKRGDLIVADEGVNAAIRTGMTLSRAKIKWFKHNDVEDLERILDEVAADDKRKGGKAKMTQRRFIICESVYRHFGDVCPLVDIVALKEKHAFRLYLDESLGFGVLGETGRGLAEELGIDREAIEVLVASMSNTLASTGGFCVGSNEVVDHQRLSGAGYCYSASAPPFMMRAASFALRCMTEDPELVADLRDKIDFTWNRAAEIHGLRVVSDVRSPLIYLTLDVPDDIEFGDEAEGEDDDDDYVQAEVGVDDEWRGMIQGVVDMEQADVSRRGGAGEVREQLQNAADVLEAWEGDFPAAAEIAEEVLAAKKDFRVKNFADTVAELEEVLARSLVPGSGAGSAGGRGRSASMVAMLELDSAAVLREIAEQMLNEGVLCCVNTSQHAAAITAASNASVLKPKRMAPGALPPIEEEPMLRLVVNASQTTKQLEKAMKSLQEVTAGVLAEHGI